MTDFLMGSTLSGSYDSHDKRQVNRATIGEGTIIIRSDPAQGLAGLNRDLQKAQELTKNSETSVTVYIDPAVVKEVAGGFKSIRDSYEKISALVKKALSKGTTRFNDSIDNQLSMRNELLKSGMPEAQVNDVLAKHGAQADLKFEVEKEVTARGGWENLSEADAQMIIAKLTSDTRFVQLRTLAQDLDGNDVELTVASSKLFLLATLNTAKNFGMFQVEMLRYLSGACANVFNVVTAGYAYADETKAFQQTNAKIADVLSVIVQNPQGIWPAAIGGLQKDWDNYVMAIEAGDADAAAKHLADAGTTLSLIVLTAGGISSSVLAKLEAKAPGFVAQVKAAQAAKAAGVREAGEAASAAQALRFRTLLAFREAGILNGNGQLTAKGISSATEIPLKGGQITNPAIVEALTQDGSSITVWGKFKTSSVAMPNGQSLQIHFYKNKLTGAIDNLTADFKVKGIVKP